MIGRSLVITRRRRHLAPCARRHRGVKSKVYAELGVLAVRQALADEAMPMLSQNNVMFACEITAPAGTWIAVLTVPDPSPLDRERLSLKIMVLLGPSGCVWNAWVFGARSPPSTKRPGG
jgi:hypothetical protein